MKKIILFISALSFILSAGFAFAEIKMSLSGTCDYPIKYLHVELHPPHITEKIPVNSDKTFTLPASVPEGALVAVRISADFCKSKCMGMRSYSTCVIACQTRNTQHLYSKWVPAKNGGVVPVECNYD